MWLNMLCYVVLICRCYGPSCKKNEQVILCFKQWCSYVTEDYRGFVKDPLKNKKHPNWERRKRGCELHYIVRTMPDRPHIVIIVYVQSQHVDKNGFPCHDHINPTVEHQWWLHCIHLWEYVKHWVRSLFFVGVSLGEIYNKHVQMLST